MINIALLLACIAASMLPTMLITSLLAKHADPTIPDSPEEWLDEFSTFSIYQVLPKIIELWA